MKEKGAAVQEYLDRHDKRYREFQTKYQGQELGVHKQEGAQVNVETLQQFWSEPQNAALIDAKMVRFCFSFATATALEGGQGENSHGLAFLGIYLATWFKLGKDTFLGALRGIPVESSHNQTLIDFDESTRKIGTDRGLILFLSKQIPCSCLDEGKKKAKEAPRARRCSYCSSQGLKLELKKCSQCKIAHYCSKRCQAADWRAGHKKECERETMLQVQLAALKAAKTRR
jgi:hypothetical protein